MAGDYKTPTIEAHGEFTEKRSRFIGYCKPVTSEEEATRFISQIRSKHWDARHNVYAYSLREGNIKRYSDDGEPSGTAGMPVLDVIVKNEVFDVCVVVTRYFGGILLGTGGLVRAYSQAAKLALDAGKVALMELCAVCTVHCSYNQYGKVSSLIIDNSSGLDGTDYGADVTPSPSDTGISAERRSTRTQGRPGGGGFCRPGRIRCRSCPAGGARPRNCLRASAPSSSASTTGRTRRRTTSSGSGSIWGGRCNE